MLKAGFSARTGFREGAPAGGGKIIFQMILRGIRQGRACTARPRWGRQNHLPDDFAGDETRTGVHSTPPLGAVEIAQRFPRGIRQCLRLQSKRRRSRLYPLFYISSNQKPLGTGQVGYDACKKTIAGKHGFGFFCQITVQFEKGRSVR